jgi:SAM-dependent methyltransferase
MPDLTSTSGYASEADALAIQYESLSFEDNHASLLPYLPESGLAIDIGAGTGRDIAGLVALGWRGVGVEPTAELRQHAMRLHPDPAIRWIDDGLPDLTSLSPYLAQADLVLLTAVWMHLTREERAAAMPRLALLLAPGGLLVMTVRHGPVPAGRRMFEIDATEIIGDAAAANLALVDHQEKRGDRLGRPDVSWTKLIFRR